MASTSSEPTPAPPTSETISMMDTADGAANSTLPPGRDFSEHSPNNAAVISGLVCGAAVLIALLCAFCWFGRSRIKGWLSRTKLKIRSRSRSRSTQRSYRLQPVGDTPSSRASEWSIKRDTWPALTRDESMTKALARSESTTWARNDLRKGSTATGATAPHDVTNIGLGMRGVGESPQTTYTCLNPDPASVTTAGERADSVPPWKQQQQQRVTPVAVRKLENTLQAYPQGYLDCSLPTMSTPGTMPPPATPATTSAGTTGNCSLPTFSSPSTMLPPVTPNTSSFTTASPARRQTPWHSQHPSTPYQQQRPEPAYTPSVYQPYPPTSLPQQHSQNRTPTSGYSSAGPSHSTLASLPDFTHTNPFVNKPTLAPPSLSINTANNTIRQTPLPQPYSTVSLGSTADIYRRIDSQMDFYGNLRELPAGNEHSPPARDSSPLKNVSTPSTSATPARNVQATPERDLYRGLSTRTNGSKNSGLPWDFLSAENAVGGGWKNRDSTGAVSGWETVREEDEESEGSPVKMGK